MATRMGLPHLLASLFFVQGLAYLSQLVIASLMRPADFGIARSTEVALSILTLIGGIGMWERIPHDGTGGTSLLFS